MPKKFRIIYEMDSTLAGVIILAVMYNVWDYKKFCTAGFFVISRVLTSKGWPDVALSLSLISASEPEFMRRVFFLIISDN